MDTLNPADCYRALLAHDARFDGCFFTGVTSTQIYCRPVCTAKVPKPENCVFFKFAAAAEAKGFRPCLRCRPELAPGLSPLAATNRLASRIKQLIDVGFMTEHNQSDLAQQLQVSDRHLRRVFEAEYGISVVGYLQTVRLLLAKQMLTETNLLVIDIAFASGFASLRRFNALFKERYRMTPASLRKNVRQKPIENFVTLSVAYRKPFAWHATLEFLSFRAIAGVESVSDQVYSRSVRIERDGIETNGWITVRCDENKGVLNLSLDSNLSLFIPTILGRVKRLFDVDCQPELIEKVLGPKIVKETGLRLLGAFDGFEMAVRAILGQQITVKAASTLAGRFALNFGSRIQTPVETITRLFPNAAAIAAIEPAAIQKIGIPLKRAHSIVALAKALLKGEILLENQNGPEELMKNLELLPGIGPWTAQYITMRALSWPDIFLSTDIGVLNALGTKDCKKAEELSLAWKPWRSYAVIHLWNSLKKSSDELIEVKKT